MPPRSRIPVIVLCLTFAAGCGLHGGRTVAIFPGDAVAAQAPKDGKYVIAVGDPKRGALTRLDDFSVRLKKGDPVGFRFDGAFFVPVAAAADYPLRLSPDSAGRYCWYLLPKHDPWGKAAHAL